MAQLAHAPLERFHAAIADAELAEVIHCVEQVVAAIAVRSPSGREIARCSFGVEPGHVALMGAIYGKGN